MNKKILKEVFNIEKPLEIFSTPGSYKYSVQVHSIDSNVKLPWKKEYSKPTYEINKETLHVFLEIWLFKNNHIKEISFKNKKWRVKSSVGEFKSEDLTVLLLMISERVLS